MGIVRNGIFTIAATGLLLGGLLLLVPQHAGASQVHLDSAGIVQPTIVTDNPGTVSDVYAFVVNAHVVVPAGERIALDFARVLVGGPSATLSGGALSPALCTADSTSVSGPRAEIVAVLGATPGFGPRTGYAYDVTASGYGYAFVNPYSIDHGYGYGYGHDSHPTKILLQLRVTGCVGPAGGAAPIPFGSPNPTLSVKVQVFVGLDPTNVLPSFPAQQTLFDPGFVHPASPSGSPALTASPISSSGGISAVSFTLSDQDGDATPFEPMPLGARLDNVPFPPGLGGQTGRAFSLRALTDLPAGSQVLFRFQDEGTVQPASSPPFGINPGVLAGILGGNPVASYFQIQLSIPGQGLVEATGRIAIDITLGIDPAYFSSAPGLLAANLRLRAFEDSGALESLQPTLVGLDNVVNGKQQSRFRITAFSAFVAFVPPAVGGGGGGGGSAATPADPGTPGPEVPDGTGHVPSDPDLADTDGDGVPDRIERAAGSDPANRASVPDYDLSASLVVRPTADGNVLTWTPHPNARGYQVWASNSPWTLLATLDATATTFTDPAGKESTKYKVTYFVGDSTAEGRIDTPPGQQADMSLLPGWDESGWRTATPSTPEGGKGGIPGTLILLVLVAALLAAVAFIYVSRRRKA